MGRLEGKVALITGAARGQGRAHAVRLASEGADIIGIDICGGFESIKLVPATVADLDETVGAVEALDRRIVARQGDVRDFERMQEIVAEGVAELGRLDIVVANAGVINCGWTWEMTATQWQEVIDINLTGVFNTCKATIPTMIAQGEGGAIVITSSTAGLYGQPFTASYTASKHGVVGLARCLANELAEHRIRVNTVHPTGVETAMYAVPELFELLQTRAETLGPVFMNALPDRVMQPEDVAATVAYLASDDARYVTGSQLRVDCGKLNR